MEKDDNMKNKTTEVLVAVGVCTVVLIGLIFFSIGTYNYFYDKYDNDKAIETLADKKTEESDETEMTVQLIDPEFIDEENDETEKEEKPEEELTEEEKQKREELRKKQEEERKKLEAEGYPYWIKVNYSANTVTIYGKDADGNYTVPVRAMVCSTGRATPHSGVYKTPNKARWGVLIGPVWGQYCTRITGQILFHSVPYLKECDPSSLEYWEYDLLGTQRSMGCIRLTVADAQWIFYNCPIGTSVEFYSDPSNPGPLGKPGIQPVTAAGDPYRGWDPTDPDPNNPWKHKQEIENQKRAEEEAARKAQEEAERQRQQEAERQRHEEERRAQEAERQRQEEERRKQEAENIVTVPNVTGLSAEQARALIEQKGLTCQIVNSQSFDSTKPENQIISQNKAGGTEVNKNEVTIILTKNYKNPNENQQSDNPSENNNSNQNENSQQNENP